MAFLSHVDSCCWRLQGRTETLFGFSPYLLGESGPPPDGCLPCLKISKERSQKDARRFVLWSSGSRFFFESKSCLFPLFIWATVCVLSPVIITLTIMGILYVYLALTVLKEFSCMLNHANNCSWIPFTLKETVSAGDFPPPSPSTWYDRHNMVQLTGNELAKFLAYISLCSQAHTYCGNLTMFTFFLLVPFINFYTFRSISPML